MLLLPPVLDLLKGRKSTILSIYVEYRFLRHCDLSNPASRHFRALSLKHDETKPPDHADLKVVGGRVVKDSLKSLGYDISAFPVLRQFARERVGMSWLCCCDLFCFP